MSWCRWIADKTSTSGISSLSLHFAVSYLCSLCWGAAPDAKCEACKKGGLLKAALLPMLVRALGDANLGITLRLDGEALCTYQRPGKRISVTAMHHHTYSSEKLPIQLRGLAMYDSVMNFRGLSYLA